jgi:glycosyltransferase involved in cell wall biosynthesis
LAVQLSNEFDVTILTTASRGAAEPEQWERVSVIRFRYFFRRGELLDSTTDKWPLLKRSVRARGVLVFYMAAFLWQALRWGRQADAILSHWLVPSGFVGACAARLYSKPHVVIEHSGALRLIHHLPAGRWLMRFIVSGSRQIITVSGELRQRLLELTPEARAKTSVIPMGISLHCVKPVDGSDHTGNPKAALNGHQVVLYVGRLAEVKGVAYLIRAMEGVARAVLVIAGDGVCEAALRRLARQHNIGAVFLGRIGERRKRAWLSRCDVVVIPSVVLDNGRTEGLPVVCLEAFAAGKPVIASRVGGLPEVIRHGETGFLVEPGNVVELRSALNRVLCDDQLRLRIGLQARSAAQPYDWAVIGNRVSQVMLSAAQDHGSKWLPDGEY